MHKLFNTAKRVLFIILGVTFITSSFTSSGYTMPTFEGENGGNAGKSGTQGTAASEVPAIAAADVSEKLPKTLKEIYEGSRVSEDVVDYIKYYNSEYPEFTEVFSIGKSLEGRELTVIKIGKGSRTIFINAEHHPREYITAILLLNQVEMLCEAYSKDLSVDGFKVRDLLDSVSIYFLPLVNPDGVEICKNENPGWYWNARGVNLNKNYDAEWRKSSRDSAAGDSGKAAFSESETKAVKDFCEVLGFDLSIAYHAAGEIIYWYFSQKGKDVERDGKLAEILSKVTGYDLVSMKSSMGGIDRGGGFKDWVVDKLHTPSFTIEVGKGSMTKPLSFSEYSSIWDKNKNVPLYMADAVKKAESRK